MNDMQAPVKMGETHEVWIDSVGEKGDGIARVKGFVLFVPNVKKGDYVKIRITKVLQKVGFAEVVEQLEKPDITEQQLGKKKFESVSAEEFNQTEEEPSQDYEETEDFGEDLDED